jgi:arylsulfatase A-like enzyme
MGEKRDLFGMGKVEERTAKVNPLAIGLMVGLGWGLCFGFVDGLPVLLESPIVQHLRVRLQAMIYLMMWYGLGGMIFLGVLGLIAWGLLSLSRREASRRSLVAVYSGVSIGLVGLIFVMQRLNVSLRRITDLDQIAIMLILIGLAGAAGAVVGVSVYSIAFWWQSGRGYLRPLRWEIVRTGVLTVFLAGLVLLSAVALYRGVLRDLAVLRPTPSGQMATPEQPNVILITIDALRAGHLGTYGYDPAISPNIDALGERGMVFEQAVSQGPRTDPSTSSFMTSLYPSELQLFQKTELRVDSKRTTLAEALHEAGYRTQAYITNPLVCPLNGFDQGFDNYTYARDKLAFDPDELHQRTLLRLVCPSKTTAAGVSPICQLFDWGHQRLFDQPLGEWMGDRWITDHGKRFLRQHKDERFFLWLFYVGPHMPYDPPEPFRPLPPEITPKQEQQLRYPGGWVREVKETIRPVDLEAMISLYDGDIHYTDELLGQLLDELDRLGLTDRTLIVLSADHGEQFADHGGYAHGALYDEIVHVPFIISGAGVEAAGRRAETQVQLLDMYPTVCEIAGVPIPDEAEGRSLVPLLRGEDMEDLPAFTEGVRKPGARAEDKAIRYDGYKLIHYVTSGRTELYDLQADPGEQVNLAKKEPEIAVALLAELEAWMEHTAQVAEELPRLRPARQVVDPEMDRILREAGY